MTAAARLLTLPLDLPTTPRSRDVEAIPRPAASAIELLLITERKAFDALETEWNDLFARAGKPTNVFQTFNFCWHWANHYLGPSDGGSAGLKLSLVIARRHGRLVMVWPLVCERVRGITQIFWMGEPVSQCGDVLIDAIPDAQEILRAGFDFLQRHATADILRLRRVREHGTVAPLMKEIGAMAADRQIAPYMDLASAKDFASFEQRYSSKARKNRRRLARRLEEKGPVEFVRLHGGVEAGDLAAKAVALKAGWLKSRGLPSKAINDERMARLFGDLAQGETRPAGCIVSALKSNGRRRRARSLVRVQGATRDAPHRVQSRFRKIGYRCHPSRTVTQRRIC